MSRSEQAKARRKAKDRENRKGRRAETAKISRLEKTASINVPRYVKITPFDSLEWESLVNGNPEAYKSAKGIALGLWGGAESPTEDWFKDSGRTGQSIRDSLFSHICKEATDKRIVEIEARFAKKFGDFKKLPWDKWADVLFDMYKTPNWKPDSEVLTRATERLISEVGHVNTLHTIEEAFAETPKHANSGFPFCTKKWASDEDMVGYYKDEASRLLKGEIPKGPAILFTRRQPKGLGVNDVKMRAVECPPKSDAIAGQMFLTPLYRRLKELEAFMGYKGASNIGNQMQTALSLYEYAFEGDFSRFDATAWTWWMGIIFDTVLPRIFGNEFTSYFSAIKTWYSNMDVITPMGIVHGTHGLFSGCIWTNIIGSFINYISTQYTMEKLNFSNDDFLHLSYGDDIAIFSEKEIPTDGFESYMSELGMDCNKAKQAQSSGEDRMISFLGFFHLNGLWDKATIGSNHEHKYIGLFPMMRMLPCLVWRERHHDYDKDTAMALGCYTRDQFDTLRYMGKMENFRNHPLRGSFLTKLFTLGFKLFSITERTANTTGLSQSRASFDVAVRNFWIMKEGHNLVELPTEDKTEENRTDNNRCEPGEIQTSINHQVTEEGYRDDNCETIDNVVHNNKRGVEDVTTFQKE